MTGETFADTVAADAKAAGAQSLHRAVQLLRVVAAENGPGVRLIDGMRRTGLKRSTTYRILQALEREGLLVQDPATERYHLSPDIYLMGIAAEQRFGPIDLALPFVRRLAATTSDTCLLQIRRGDHSVCLAREDGDFPIRTHTAKAGDRHPLGVGAGGLAMLATLDDDEVAAIVRRTRDELDVRYALTPTNIFDLVERTRANGFAFNPGRIFPGSFGIGVAIVDETGMLRGSLALAGIELRFAPQRIDELVAILRSVAVECARSWSPPPFDR